MQFAERHNIDMLKANHYQMYPYYSKYGKEKGEYSFYVGNIRRNSSDFLLSWQDDFFNGDLNVNSYVGGIHNYGYNYKNTGIGRDYTSPFLKPSYNIAQTKYPSEGEGPAGVSNALYGLLSFGYKNVLFLENKERKEETHIN